MDHTETTVSFTLKFTPSTWSVITTYNRQGIEPCSEENATTTLPPCDYIGTEKYEKVLKENVTLSERTTKR